MLASFESDLDLIETQLLPGKVEACAALASLPMLYRGYGHVRRAAVERAAGERQRLIERLRSAEAEPAMAAAE